VKILSDSAKKNETLRMTAQVRHVGVCVILFLYMRPVATALCMLLIGGGIVAGILWYFFSGSDPNDISEPNPPSTPRYICGLHDMQINTLTHTCTSVHHLHARARTRTYMHNSISLIHARTHARTHAFARSHKQAISCDRRLWAIFLDESSAPRHHSQNISDQ